MRTTASCSSNAPGLHARAKNFVLFGLVNSRIVARGMCLCDVVVIGVLCFFATFNFQGQS